VADPPVSFDNVSENLEESLTIIVVEEDVLSGISPAGKMMHRTFKLDSEWPCHNSSIAIHHAIESR
jgi:hypothetical protein